MVEEGFMMEIVSPQGPLSGIVLEETSDEEEEVATPSSLPLSGC